MNIQSTPPLKANDYATDQDVRWCPGCGDYAILKCVQKTLADLQADPAKTVFVSGIGCSSRFPYYMATYGFHTIHGRAPAFATGIKLSNPDLDVWMVTGDGDALSIGGNHLYHVLRRNVNMQILLFNNEIYGLTKGQYSPTSSTGQRSPSSPEGSVDTPIDPVQFALGSGAHFVAREIDTQAKGLSEVLKRAHAYKGTAFVEILQNCIVFNDAIFEDISNKKTAADTQIVVKHGEPLIFGKDGDKGLVFDTTTFGLKVVTIGQDGIGEGDILVHDETNRTLAGLLGALHLPRAVGVIYAAPEQIPYEEAVHTQVDSLKPTRSDADFDAMMRRGNVWKV